MAKWKAMSQLAVAMREAEKQAELKRIQQEQFQESIKNGNILRKLAREKSRITCTAKVPVVKDERVLAVLAKEKESAERDTSVAKSEYYRRQDERHLQVLMENLQSKDITTGEVNRVRDKLRETQRKEKEVDKEIQAMQHKLKAFNRELSNVHVVHPDKVVRRQEIAQQNYGKQLESNRQLREQLDHLEGEKNKLDRILRDLREDCEMLSKELHEYSEIAKDTYEGRDMDCLNMAKLEDHMDKNTAAFDSDMQLMQFNIDVLRRTERFMTSKNKFRPDEGRERRRELRSQMSVTEKDSVHFGTLLTKIRQELKQEDVQLIIRTFKHLQDENYMLFQNISQTRDSCHDMVLENETVRAQISTIRKARQESEQEAFARKVELVDKAQRCQKEAEKKEEYIQKADQVIQTYIKGVLSMLKKMGYTEEHILQLTGVLHCVEERNIHVFMAELEHYINRMYDLKTISDFLAYDEARKSAHMPLPPEHLPPRLVLQQRVVVVPPQTHEGEEVDDPALPTEADFRPLNVFEICHHVEEDLEARERREELGVPVPSPTMTDVTSEAIGDSPQSPVMTKGLVDIF